ncbi:MAG: short-chain dehydrogenase/reductase [Lutibacter sp.]|nr:MAG: short-chain dehydrogenase/reductase [Lutibacter sp.]
MSTNKNLPVVLITGCSSGHGEALAKLFIKNGYPTYASARKLESIEELKKLGCETLQIDVTDYDTIHKAVETIEKTHDSVGILVNNAAIGIMTPMETIPMEEVKKQYETNVFGLLAMTQAVLPKMRKAGKGRIVNIGSSGGEFTTPGGGIYQATKYALTSMNDAMRAELEPFGIYVSMIQPGAIASKFAQNGAVLGYKEKGPYQELMLGINKITSAAVKKGAPGTWTPEQVAKVSFKAATKRKPRARYRPGFVAKALIYTRLWLPYRMWDKMFMNMMLKQGKKIKQNQG